MAHLAIQALAVLALASLFMVLLMHVSVRRVLSRPAPDVTPEAVTILKPLRGIDDSLADNLESYAHLEGEYELLFGAEDPRDPALDVAREFCRRHPEIDAKVIVCDRVVGMNPKVIVLAQLTPHAKHPLLLVSDSNVRLKPGFLRETAAHFADPQVGLVSNVIAGVGEKSFGSALENAHLASFISGAISGADVVAGQACVLGKSMMVRRRAFDRLGGWTHLRNVLAEDYFAGYRFQKAGYKVVLSGHVVETVVETWSWDRFFARHVRWSQLRRRLSPATYFLEVFLNPLPFALTLACVGGSSGLAAGAAIIATKYASDRSIARQLRGTPPPLAAMIGRDLLLPFVWFVGGTRTFVEWRGHRIRLGKHTRLHRPPAATSAVLAHPNRVNAT
ncbi:MAG TPA: ceramide glucosyltransferase [bacterium]|nr:ceramide glucosyltransferase [bacterium]